MKEAKSIVIGQDICIISRNNVSRHNSEHDHEECWQAVYPLNLNSGLKASEEMIVFL